MQRAVSIGGPVLMPIKAGLTQCTALPVGFLVKDEYFTLYESVGALEVGD